MKNTVIVFISLMFVFCNSQDKRKKHIHDFMETVILNDSYDIRNINEFMNIDKDSLGENTKTYELIQFYKEYFRSEITKNKIEDFEILNHKEFNEKEVFEDYDVIYDHPEYVYYIVHNDTFITPIILDEENNIIAFFTGIIKDKNRIVPYLL